MAWLSSGTSNTDLVNQLWRNGLITDARVKEAFLKVDRAHYAPTAPYHDSPQSIGHAATISAPHMHASAVEHLLEYLVPRAEEQQQRARRVLDVGSGSGYLTHVLAELVGRDDGVVVGVEHVPQLRELAQANMARSARGRELLARGRVRFVVGDGRRGCAAEGAEWDAIHVGASAAELHAELVEQLRAPGRMFIPVDDGDGEGGGQHVWVVDKDRDGRVSKRRLFGVSYVPLTDAPAAVDGVGIQ